MPAIADRVTEQLVRLAYSLLPVGLIATVINGILVAYLHRRLVPGRFLLVWIAALAFITGTRSISLMVFRRKTTGPFNLGKWKAILVAGMIGSGMAWGSSAFFMLFHQSLPHQVLVAFVLGGMVAGSAATFSPLHSVFYGFVIPAVIPQVLVFFMAGDPIHYGMAAMLALFCLLISSAAETNRKIVLSSFRLRFEREELIAVLMEERNRVERNYSQLKDEVSRRQQLEQQLRTAHADLEKKVQERTTQLSTANERLQEANNELATFTHSVSHDLRAPLRGIDGFSRILQEDYSTVLDEEGRRYLSMVRGTTARMQALIEDLLTLSRVTQAEIQRGPVNLSLLAEDIVDALRQRDPTRTVDISIQQDCVADGDSRLMRIALENLIENAWKYTSATQNPRIEFGKRKNDGQQAVFFVTDNGAGFDMKYADKLFRPFQRLHSETDFPGTGIGLATVHRVIRRHNGKIWAESTPGKGAAFFFTL